MPTDRETGQPDETLSYAGFWPRFAALLLDGLIWALVPLLSLWVPSSRFYLLYYLVPAFVFQLFYEVYLVERWGGTPGKLIMGLRILKTNGQPVGYREALLRAAPEVIFDVLTSMALLIASLQITASDYRAIPFLHQSQRLIALAPSWYRPLDITQNVWIWSELIVLLTNRKKRALHDFLAGTVVARVRPIRLPTQQPDLASTP